MRKSDAKKYYKTNAAMARVLNVSVQAIGAWGEIVPYFSARSLARDSRGALRVNERDYDERGRPIKVSV